MIIKLNSQRISLVHQHGSRTSRENTLYSDREKQLTLSTQLSEIYETNFGNPLFLSSFFQYSNPEAAFRFQSLYFQFGTSKNKIISLKVEVTSPYKFIAPIPAPRRFLLVKFVTRLSSVKSAILRKKKYNPSQDTGTPYTRVKTLTVWFI